MKHAKRTSYYFLSGLLTMLLGAASAYAHHGIADPSVALQREISSETVISFSLPPLNINPPDTDGYHQLAAEGLSVASPGGFPGVLIKSFLLQIPADSEVTMSVIIEQQETIRNFLLSPAPTPVMQENERSELTLKQIFEKNEAAYAKDILYPGKFAEVAYTGFLRDIRVAKVNLYPVQYNPVTRELLLCKKMTVTVRYEKASSHQHNTSQRQSQRSASGTAPDKVFEGIYRKTLLNYTPQQKLAPGAFAPQSPHQLQAALSENMSQSPFAIKALVTDDGIYKITYEDLLALGVDLASATNENIAMANQGNDIAIYCSGSGTFKPGDYILFYGQSFKSLYSKTNVYWLYLSEEHALRMTQRNGTPQGNETVQPYFTQTKKFEQDRVYWSNIPPYDEGVDHWFWDKLSINEEALEKDFTVSLGTLEKNGGTFTLTLQLQGRTGTSTSPDHHTRVYVNGTMAGDFTWDGQTVLTQSITDINPAFFKNGDNTITVEAVADTGSVVDSYYVNWIEVMWHQQYVADNNRLAFRNKTTGAVQYTVTGFSSSDMVCLDVTDPVRPVMITGTVSSESTLRFRDVVSQTTAYAAAAGTGIRAPQTLSVDAASDLKSYRSAVDYIIITHEDFYDAVQELKTYRESKGLHVEVVKIQDIYDEFSYGIKDAQAIKDFLTYAYTSWNSSGHPTYVLLVGDASLDYRDDLGYYAKGAVDYVPTFIYQTNQFGNTPTDNWFVCVNGTDYLPDMILGRISVRTSTDLKNIIAKIKAYEASPPAAWCGNVILAADNESIFESISDSLAKMLPEGYQAKKVYLDQYPTVKDATTDLISKINAGALITNYAGHGNVNEWAAEYLFQTADQTKSSSRDDLQFLSNGDKLTFVMALNCLNGYFPNWLDDYSLAEDFLRVENRGAIACFAPTALGYPSEHSVLARKIFSGLFEEENKIVGSLITAAKISTYQQINSRDIIETFTLFGDPATELKLVSSSDMTAFRTVKPSDGEPLPFIPLPTFTWGAGLYDRFKVQFSPQPDFTPELTITAPLIPLRFLQKTSYTPSFFIWIFVNLLGATDGQMYWRVVAYDEYFNQIAMTDPVRFTLQR